VGNGVHPTAETYTVIAEKFEPSHWHRVPTIELLFPFNALM